MKANTKALKASLVLAVSACLLALPHARARSSRQAETRGVSIRMGDGKDLRLYERSYALVIGVSNYTAGWPNLPGVKRDIEEVARALERQGFQVTKVENPDSAQLEKAFKEFIDAYGVSVENRLLFYFAGHGHTVKQSYGDEMGYIVPSDAPHPKRDASGFMSKAMDMQQMELYARRIQSKHALFIFDSCFSGAVFALSSRAIPDSITYNTARPVRQFITSGSAEETVPDRSIFREQFIEAIEGEADSNHDNYVTGTELGMFLQDKVINYSKNTQHPQYGKLRNPNLDKGDFVFALPKTSKPSDDVASNTTRQPAPTANARQTTTPAGIELVWIPPGSFMMGSERMSDEGPVHRVTFREGFYMGKYEVTRAQWRKIMGADPRKLSDVCTDPDCPASEISWDDAITFVVKLNAQNDGYSYRLPSEAEWEYAARAGTAGDYAGDLDSIAWYANNSGASRANASEMYKATDYYSRVRKEKGVRAHPVGTRLPNAFGLFDMHGNVWEWAQDWYHNSYTGAPTDGSAWVVGGEQKYRVLRGGSWWSPADDCRSAYRRVNEPDFFNVDVGFRVVAVARR